MSKFDIAVIPGDGIGPEVTAEALKVMEKVERETEIGFNIEKFPPGADHYLSTGELLSDKIKSDISDCDALFLGAVGDPRVKPGVLERGILLDLRFSFDQFVNLRPINLLHSRYTPLKDKDPEDIDMVVLRENTEGLYVNSGGFLHKDTENEVAVQEMINSYRGVKRIVDYAFNFAAAREGRLILSDKSNVLGYAHDLWQRVFNETAEENRDVKGEHILIDALAMKMVRSPEEMDVIVTCNMFGDIITDLGAELQGGMGMAVSANINPDGISMFEPVHGSAPDIAGRGKANPAAAILAAAEMLKNLSLMEEAARVEKAVRRAIKEERITEDMGGSLNTEEMGDYICNMM